MIKICQTILRVFKNIFEILVHLNLNGIEGIIYGYQRLQISQEPDDFISSSCQSIFFRRYKNYKTL